MNQLAPRRTLDIGELLREQPRNEDQHRWQQDSKQGSSPASIAVLVCLHVVGWLVRSVIEETRHSAGPAKCNRQASDARVADPTYLEQQSTNLHESIHHDDDDDGFLTFPPSSITPTTIYLPSFQLIDCEISSERTCE